jgi:hypothetical protein
MLLVLNPTPLSAAFALGLIGIGYGIVSGLAADAMARSTGQKNQFVHVAGRLYIAWCAPAIGLPVSPALQVIHGAARASSTATGAPAFFQV